MKYYILMCALMVSLTAYGQVELRADGRAQLQTREVTPRVQLDSDARTRVQSLTDVNINGRELLKSQFNTTQQFRLENAGKIDAFKEEKKESVREFIQAKKESWGETKVRLSDFREKKVKDKTSSIIARLNNATTKLVNIDAKIQAFITEETSTETIESFNEAHALLEAAQISVGIVSEELEVETEAEAELSFEAIRDLVMQAKNDLQEAWNAYINVNAQLRTEVTNNKDNN